MKLDVLFVNPNDSKVYQGLADKHSSIEPNIWLAMLANVCRNKGFGVSVYDAKVERHNNIDGYKIVQETNPRLIVVVVTGNNPNASTMCMDGAVEFSKSVKDHFANKYPICFVGPHINALPIDTLEIDSIDIVLLNEGVYALQNLLASNLDSDLPTIKGIGYKDNGIPTLNPPEQIVPQERLEIDLPLMAIDLLPSPSKYRTSSWHTNYNFDDVYNYSSLYTSLGCIYQCSFCMINIINRTNNDSNISAANSNIFRHWKPEFIVDYLELLANKGIKNLKIADEMHVLKPKHFLRIWELAIERGLHFNIWGYTRIDTVKDRYLETLKKAGFSYLGIGIESANQTVRQEITKGSFKDINIRDVIGQIHSHGINVGANYIYGLGSEKYDDMVNTYNLACELNTTFANMYANMCLPGSPDYIIAKQNNTALPPNFAAHGFLSYECFPLNNQYLSNKDILRFRDEHIHKYYERPEYKDMIKEKFGDVAVKNIDELYSIRLKRKILE